MKKKFENRVNAIKRFIRCFPKDIIWLFKHYGKVKRFLGELEINNVTVFKFGSWHSGFNYFTGTYKGNRVFVKICVETYNTIETEGYMMKYNDLDFFPKVLFFSSDGVYRYIVTEYIDSKRIDKNLPLEVKKSIISQACHILDIMMERGIIHRDIRPENLMLSESGKLYLFDFGWAVYRDSNYAVSRYSFIEKILNMQYRCSERVFDDAYSMYLSLCELFEDNKLDDLCEVRKKIGHYVLENGRVGSFRD